MKIKYSTFWYCSIQYFIKTNLYVLTTGNDHSEKLDLKGFSEVATTTELLLISMRDKYNVPEFEDKDYDINDVKIFLQIYEVLNFYKNNSRDK